MGPDSYAVAQAEQLSALPGPPLTENQRELLSAFLRNPFLDEDTRGLAARTGLRRDELLEGLEALVEAGLLKSAGRRGFMLDLEAFDPEIEYADKLLPLSEPAVEEKGAEPVDIASAELLASSSFRKSHLMSDVSEYRSTLTQLFQCFFPHPRL